MREAVDSEMQARTLEELYVACPNVPPSKLVCVALQGDDSKVRLHFASYKRRARG